MKRSMVGALATIMLCASRLATAEPFGDELTKCVVASTTPEDRKVYVSWIFTMITLHPDLASMSSVTAKQREDLSRQAGVIADRLILGSCLPQVQEAVQYEGVEAVQFAFQALYQQAMAAMLTDPHVLAGIGDFAKYTDGEKLKRLMAPATQK